MNSNSGLEKINEQTEMAPNEWRDSANKILDEEAKQIINQIATELDGEKIRNLTNLFNANMVKKNMLRLSTTNELYDTVTKQMITRFVKHPEQITTTEYIQAIRTINDIIDREERRVSGVAEKPLIEIKAENINMDKPTLTAESREKIKNVFASLFSDIERSDDIIEVENTNTVTSEEEN